VRSNDTVLVNGNVHGLTRSQYQMNVFMFQKFDKWVLLLYNHIKIFWRHPLIMPDIAVGRSYLVNDFMSAGKKSDTNTVNVNEFLQGSTPAGASRAVAVNMGVKIPDDLHMTPETAQKLDELIDKGYKVMGTKDFTTTVSHWLGGK
jgi:hypothetical protein